MSTATATEVREQPIIFSAGMVQAILAGHKSQTRRLVKPQPKPCPGYSDERDLKWDVEDGLAVRTDDQCAKYIATKRRCPYGQPGDRLWVRETFVLENTSEYDGTPPTDGIPFKAVGGEDGSYYLIPHYRATEPDAAIENGNGDWQDTGTKWSSPLFMPRWASRLTLEITNVRVQRLQDIDVNDACAEGAPIYDDSKPRERHDVLTWFEEVWESIHGEGSWKVNPFVWALTFWRA